MSVGRRLLRRIIDENARGAWRDVNPEVFSDDEQPVYQFVSMYYREHGMLPSVQAVTENGYYLEDAPDPMSYYFDRIRRRSVMRVVQDGYMDLATAMQAQDVERVVSVIATMNRGMALLNDSDDVLDAETAFREVLADYEVARLSTGLRGVTFGWPYLDEITYGAMGGDVITVAGRPGMGKSYTLLSMALAAWRARHPVLFVSMEMSLVQTARRLLGMMIGLNPDLIRRGQVSTWTEGRLREAVDSPPSPANFHILAGNFSARVSTIDALVQEHSPDVVYIDASYVLHPSTRMPNQAQWEAIAEVGAELKRLAQRREVPVIQSLQVNREGGKSRSGPDIEHLAGGDAAGQLSSIVLLLRSGEGEHDKTQRRYEIVKNRDGAVGSFTTNYRFNPFNMDQIESAPFDDGHDDAFGDTDNVDWDADPADAGDGFAPPDIDQLLNSDFPRGVQAL